LREIPRRVFKFAGFSAIFTGGYENKWAGRSPFFFGAAIFQAMTTKLGELLERTLPPLGYELVDWEGAPGGRLVRVFIDKTGGITVDDCARVSNHLTHLFAVENIEFERLEVSSPGLDRPLRKAADFVRFAGEEAELKLTNPIANAKKLKGVLRGCDAGAVVVETANGAVAVPLAAIARARLVPKIEWRKAR